MLDNLQTVYPVDPLLKQFIYCYYIVEDTDENFRNTHYSFPHTLNAVTIYNNGTLHKSTHHIKIVGNQTYSPFCLLQGKCQHPLLIDLEGKLSRITILFKPLGLNNFIKPPLDRILKAESCLFTEWCSPTFDSLLHYLFTGNNIHLRIHSIEDYLLSIFTKTELPELHKTLMYLSEFDNERSVESISRLVNVPLRTLNRLFKTHLGVSPIVHRQIARFRYSLEERLFNNGSKKLTEIGYQSNFYDQSYFNKVYRQLSGSNPKKFFKTAEQVGNIRLVFQFVKS